MFAFRKILFYAFVFIYLIGCPVIILDSLGIVFLPNQKKIIQSTGLISLATTPEGASVFIDNKAYDEKTPTIIRDLPEGEYDIRITLDRYRPWERSVPVVKEQATALEDILLTPTEWPKDVMSLIEFDRIFCIYDNPYIVFCKGMLFRGAYVFELGGSIISALKDDMQYSGKKTLRPLFAEDSKYNSFRLSSVVLMPKSPFALIQAKENGKNHYLWVDLRAAGSPILDISHLFVSSPDKIIWDHGDNENIFYLSEKNINRIDIKENAVYPDIARNIKSFGVFNKRLLVVTEAGEFDAIDYMSDTKEPLMGEWSRMPEVFNASSTLNLRILSERLILFIDDKGRLFSTRLPYELIPSKVSAIGDVLDGSRVLVWTKTRLGHVDFKSLKQEGVFEAGPRVRWVIQDAHDIQQAFWVNNGSHILFRDLDQIRLVESNVSAAPSIVNVGDAKGAVAYSDLSGKVFFIDRDTKKFVSLTVVPAHGLTGLALPEVTGKKAE